MKYNGGGVYEVIIGNKNIDLHGDDIKQIIYEFIKCSDEIDLMDIIESSLEQIHDRFGPIIASGAKQLVDITFKHVHVQKHKPKRSHNKKELILKLFDKYSSDTKTKKEVFGHIANELNITIKAVEKAYYSK